VPHTYPRWPRKHEVNPTHAAEYLRMSTDQQQYSLENQATAIRVYAAVRGFKVIRTYSDAAKSGLNIEGRPALQDLLRDVESGRADFRNLLVYDVSRWGRFQDSDEAAFYEYRCKRAGIRIAYCNEPFDNDGSSLTSIIKGVKRIMASEYSRDLSTKVFQGKRRLIELGYWQGGPPGFGFRRALLDPQGKIRGYLAPGDRKALQSERVIIVPGPKKEVQIVNQMYRWCADEGHSPAEIAKRLNAMGVLSDLGNPWTLFTVRQLLTHEKYIGTNVWNRRTLRLRTPEVKNPEHLWIRKENAFQPLVTRDLWQRAQVHARRKSRKLIEETMLQQLRDLFKQHGYLTHEIINRAHGVPSIESFKNRFGGLLQAYQRVGFVPDFDYDYVPAKRRMPRIRALMERDVSKRIRDAGGEVRKLNDDGPLLVNNAFSLSVNVANRVLRGFKGKFFRWRVRINAGRPPDFIFVARLDPKNDDVQDYFLVPRWVFEGQDTLYLHERNPIEIETCRFNSFDRFVETGLTSLLSMYPERFGESAPQLQSCPLVAT